MPSSTMPINQLRNEYAQSYSNWNEKSDFLWWNNVSIVETFKLSLSLSWHQTTISSLNLSVKSNNTSAILRFILLVKIPVSVETIKTLKPNFAIASYHIVAGEKTHIKVEQFFAAMNYPFKTIRFRGSEIITFAGPNLK